MRPDQTAADGSGARGDRSPVPSAGAPEVLLCPGVRIVNGRGVPGTLGALGITLHDGAAVLLSNHHVLFGAGAAEGEPVWLLGDHPAAPAFFRLGTSLYGRLGAVMYNGLGHYVDCAVAAVDPRVRLPAAWRLETEPDPDGQPLQRGSVVTKAGAATGQTRGIVVDADASASASASGTRPAAPHQIVARSLEPGIPFSADGDSGALLCDERGAPVGLLWGVNARGDSLACPIAPVLWLLGIRLAPPGALTFDDEALIRPWLPTKS